MFPQDLSFTCAPMPLPGSFAPNLWSLGNKCPFILTLFLTQAKWKQNPNAGIYLQHVKWVRANVYIQWWKKIILCNTYFRIRYLLLQYLANLLNFWLTLSKTIFSGMLPISDNISCKRLGAVANSFIDSFLFPSNLRQVDSCGLLKPYSLLRHLEVVLALSAPHC